ncbi:hypothetical protein E0H77_05910 [Acinetobacter sp. ANC 4633]|uniref:hypothetical protein n=1 Tax=Acinetobacter sp. ANC 4633 TaxID=2529845 RepID=UPI00103E56E6|nr:hypothetical protein [Acinetobacter sp. ANC 4633]TCB27141.1 hypothetical protein E0H77_05910 [Acinetobacter sp. ANC 4633]
MPEKKRAPSAARTSRATLQVRRKGLLLGVLNTLRNVALTAILDPPDTWLMPISPFIEKNDLWVMKTETTKMATALSGMHINSLMCCHTIFLNS